MAGYCSAMVLLSNERGTGGDGEGIEKWESKKGMGGGGRAIAGRGAPPRLAPAGRRAGAALSAPRRRC
jgi:hypothetical protein